MPEKDKNFNRTIAYLTRTRSIDKEIVYAMIRQGKVYGARTTSEKTGYSFHNCAFVGYDESGKARYCAYAHPVLTAISVKALYRYLQIHPEIEEIVFCYDNDVDGKLADGTPHNHGQVQAEISAETFADLGYKCFIQTPKTKDFNQDLITFRVMLQENRDEQSLEVVR